MNNEEIHSSETPETIQREGKKDLPCYAGKKLGITSSEIPWALDFRQYLKTDLTEDPVSNHERA